ncbi:MAG: hypothetical protein HY902_07725 [Deltaproteobacteria bacterium]|nr:hypothetical protein [Deltaproteobacteria bacterium]
MPRQALLPALFAVFLSLACGPAAVPPSAKPDAASDASNLAATDTADSSASAADVPPDATAPVSDVSSGQDTSGGACMTVQPKSVVFGAVAVGSSQGAGVLVCNCGASELLITSLALAGAPKDSSEFSVNVDDLVAQGLLANPPPVSTANPLDLAPGKCVPIKVKYAPTDTTPSNGLADSGTLVIGASGADTVAIPVSANMASGQCPGNIVSVAEGAMVIPQTLLHLHCDISWLPIGQAKCQWSLKQPAGSGQALEVGSTGNDRTLLANVAGEYEICVDVYGPDAGVQCTSCVTVLVIPDSAIHIELLWHTPADPDESDVGPAAGADLDLHFAHSMAANDDLDCDGKPDPWFSNPFDTFWYNAAPQWGKPNYSPDNPTLDLDDTDGAGPENLNLAAPEGTAADPMAYTVGVHYWNDHGYGTSYAALNLWLYGSLFVQYTKVKLDPLDMWTVGKLWWPNKVSGGSKPLFEPCWQSGDSCAAKKDLMWQSAGQSCIAKCYMNVSALGPNVIIAPPKCP